MYIAFVLVLACLPAWAVWRRLGGTSLPKPVRVLLTALAGVLAFLALYCLLLYLSVLLFFWNDRPM